MDFKRSDRVAERIRADISDLLLKKVHDPRIGFVSITRVKASDDLRNMTVYVSAFGQDDAAKKRTLDGLKSATPFLEREVFRGLNIKVSPELIFRLDDSLEKGQQVLQAIKEAIAADSRPAEETAGTSGQARPAHEDEGEE
jgi:ribosome-binding factor A